MDFKQLRSFVAVADCGSFTQAAARLYTSQPTVSSHIRQLEDELHQRLFLRTTKTLSITPHGRELYEYAVQVLSMQEQLFAGWQQDGQLITLGASTIPSAYILPELLPAFRAHCPKASFRTAPAFCKACAAAGSSSASSAWTLRRTIWSSRRSTATPWYSSPRPQKPFPPLRRRVSLRKRSCAAIRSSSVNPAAAARSASTPISAPPGWIPPRSALPPA